MVDLCIIAMNFNHYIMNTILVIVTNNLVIHFSKMVNVDTKLTHITTDGSNSGSLGQQMFDMSA